MALQLGCRRSVIPSTLHSARSWRVLAGSLTSQGLPLLRGCPLLLPQLTAHRSGVQPARARFWGRSQDGSQEQATVAVPAPGPSPAAPQPKPLLGCGVQTALALTHVLIYDQISGTFRCIIATRSAVCGLSDESSCMRMRSCLQSWWGLSAQTHPSWLPGSSGGRRIGHLGMVNISRFWGGIPHAGPP